MPMSAPPVPVAAASPVEKFTFPAYDKWAETNPNGSWDDWTDAKLDARDVWRDGQATARQQAQQREQAHVQRQQSMQQQMNAYAEKRQAFELTHKDFTTVTQAALSMNEPDPPLLVASILADDNGPALVYHLAQHPHEYHEMRLLTDGKPVTDAFVASVRRALAARLQAGTTGAAGTQIPPRRQPKPPTPVRTRPIQTATDDAPGDGSSLAEHEAFFNQKRRR